MKRSIVAVLGVSAAISAQAGSFKMNGPDVTLNGGAAGGLYMANNVGDKDKGSLVVSDVILGMKTSPIGKGLNVSFEGAIGSFVTPTVFDGGVNRGSANDVVIPYAWMSVAPIKELRIDMGQLATTVGYESAPSLSNPNILRGMLWSAQPTYYPGIRANYAIGDIGVFAEINEGTQTVTTDDAWAIGATGQLGKDMSFGATYFDTDKGLNYFDVIGKMNLNGMEVGANLDVVMVDKEASATGKAATAIGIALYVTPKVNSIEIPVRLEFASDSDNAVYGSQTIVIPTIPPTTFSTTGGAKGGFSLTVTPTIKTGDNAFVRAEFAFTNTGADYFADKDGSPTKTQIAGAIQAGYLF